MMTTHTAAALMLTTLGVGALAGCGDQRSSSGSQGDATAPTSREQEPPGTAPVEEASINIVITIGEQRFRAALLDSAASRDLIAQLPQTVEMTDHGGVEKTGRLRTPLSLDGQPSSADPAVGDVGYYAPGNDLVLYYGDQSEFPGIVILGRLEDDAATQIAHLGGRVTTTVEAR